MKNSVSFKSRNQIKLSQSLDEPSLNEEPLYPDVSSIPDVQTDIDKIEKINLKIASLELDGQSK